MINIYLEFYLKRDTMKYMTTKEMQKLNRLEKEVKILKNIVANLVPFDNKNEYKKNFENEMKKISKENSTFEYSGKGSLAQNLRQNA